jgi:hypothetical protein
MASSQAEIYEEIRYFERLIAENEQLIREDTAYFDRVGWNQASPGQMDGMRNKIYEWEDHIKELRARLRTIEYEESLSPEQRTLERLRRDSSILEQFIKRTNCAWNQQDWLGLLDDLRRAGFTPLDAAEVGKFLEQLAKQRLNDSEKKARETLANAEKKLQALSSQRVQEFAPNEIQSAQSNFAKAKQLVQTKSYVNYLKCTELASQVINLVQKAEDTKKRVVAERRRPYEEKLKNKESSHYSNISFIRNEYDPKIRELEKLKKQKEDKFSKFKNKPSGWLWVFAILGGYGIWWLYLSGLPIGGLLFVIPRIGFSLGGVPVSIPHILFVYLLLRLLRGVSKMVAARGIDQIEEEIKKLSKIKDDEISSAYRRFSNDPEVIELNQKIKSSQ